MLTRLVRSFGCSERMASQPFNTGGLVYVRRGCTLGQRDPEEGDDRNQPRLCKGTRVHRLKPPSLPRPTFSVVAILALRSDVLSEHGGVA